MFSERESLSVRAHEVALVKMCVSTIHPRTPFLFSTVIKHLKAMSHACWCLQNVLRKRVLVRAHKVSPCQCVCSNETGPLLVWMRNCWWARKHASMLTHNNIACKIFGKALEVILHSRVFTRLPLRQGNMNTTERQVPREKHYIWMCRHFQNASLVNELYMAQCRIGVHQPHQRWALFPPFRCR